MEQLLRGMGHTIAPFSEVCDGYIINTCSVTAVADKKNRAVIRRVRREHPEAVLACCGCYPQHAADTLRQMDIEVIHIDYDQEKVDEFWRDAEAMLQDRTFEIRKNDYCTYCDYKNLCKPPRKFKKKPI